MNARQRRKAIRAGTHYRCDNCPAFCAFPYYALTGCRRCWNARRARSMRTIATTQVVTGGTACV